MGINGYICKMETYTIVVFALSFALSLIKHLFRKSEDSWHAALGWGMAFVWVLLYYAKKC